MSLQRGNTLVISLILLLVFTMIGLSSIGNVTFNQKMTSNYKEADLSFQAAEAALAEGEAFAENLSASLSEANFEGSCSGSDCFTSNCTSGQCFNGTYSVGDLCNLSQPAVSLAKNDSTWTVAGRARESQVNFPGLSEKPKFIIEFLCYVRTNPTAPAAGISIPPDYTASDWAYLFRVTSYAKGSSGKSRTMLQSTYKVIR